MALTIKYTDTALAMLRMLDKQAAKRIIDFMDQRVAALEDPPDNGKALTGPLGGFWRYRVGDYRIICDIHDDELIILVVKIGNRRDVYR